MYADDVIIYTSAETSDELQMKLQLCVDNVHQWYNMNRLTVNKKKSAVMVIGSKAQLQSLNLDQFSINLDSNKIEFVNKAKYLGLLVKYDLSWADHILQLCKTMNYYVHVLRRLKKIFPKQLLLKIYKSYVQSKLDYGLSIWGCTTEGNLDRVQRIQNFCVCVCGGWGWGCVCVCVCVCVWGGGGGGGGWLMTLLLRRVPDGRSPSAMRENVTTSLATWHWNDRLEISSDILCCGYSGLNCACFHGHPLYQVVAIFNKGFSDYQLRCSTGMFQDFWLCVLFGLCVLFSH